MKYSTPSPNTCDLGSAGENQNEISNEGDSQTGGDAANTTAAGAVTNDNSLERKFVYLGSLDSMIEHPPSDRSDLCQEGGDDTHTTAITATDDNSLERRFIYLGSLESMNYDPLADLEFVLSKGKGLQGLGLKSSNSERTSSVNPIPRTQDTRPLSDVESILDSTKKLLTSLASKSGRTRIGIPFEWDEFALETSVKNEVSRSLRGSVWMSSGWGGQSVIGSWIEDE